MIGDRIKQARTAAGLSQRDLAAWAGISAMAVHKYEAGKNTPSSGVLLALARALGVRTEYFFRASAVELKEVEYRKHARLPKKILRQIEGDVIEQIERYLELEEYLPSRPIEPFQVPKGVPEQIDDPEQIEHAAQAVRDAWALGVDPIYALMDTLEERGIKVFRTDAIHGQRFDGLAAAVDGIPIIVVDANWPGDRQRFTLAHELGHRILKGRLAEGIDEEKAAHRFAGAFLVPESEVRKELGERRHWLEPRELCVLKKAYGLSMQAWVYRARDAGILNAQSHRDTMRFFREHGWHLKEPCEEYPQEEPQLFMQLVFRALAEELIGESKAAELLRVSMEDFHRIRDVGRSRKELAGDGLDS